MKEQLILALCLGFTVFLFYRERTQRLHTSAALWVPLIWFLILASRPVALWFSTGAINTEEDYVAGNPLDRNIYILLIVLGFAILLQRLYRLRGLFRNNQWLLLFIFYCGLSLLWSDYPEVAGKRFLRSMGSLLMVLIIVTEADPFEAIKCILRRTGYVLIPLSLVLIKYFRDLGVMYSLWGGGRF